MRSYFKKFGASQSKEGFTLVELLVSMGVFLIIITVVINIFVFGVNGAQRLFATQEVLDAGRYIMESMAKEMRMSKIKECDGNLIDGDPISEIGEGIFVSGCGSLTIEPERKQQGATPVFLVYAIDNAAGQVKLDGSALNSSKVKITGFFYPYINNVDSQPRVVIKLKIESLDSNPSRRVELNLQTTVSSREYGSE